MLCRACFDLLVSGYPPEPAAERSPVRVDGVDTDTLIAEKRGIDEDEAEAMLKRWVGEERAELVAEDGGICTSAMKAEYSWEGKSCWVGRGVS